jgi:hypothetical protein
MGEPRSRLGWLLASNVIVGSVLLYPTFGQMFYFHYRQGIPKFLALTWLGLLFAAITVWRRPLSSPSRIRLFLVAWVTSFLPPVTAFGIMLHTLFWKGSIPDPSTVFSWLGFAFTSGALFTAGYWVPFTFVNYRALRKRAA